jgi:hypothetical protein
VSRDNIRRAFEFRKMRIELVDTRLLHAPSVGIPDLGGLESKRLIALDTIFLKAIFGRVRTVTLAESACDLLFLYAALEADGSVVGSTPGLREIIRDSGAKIVVFGLPNRRGDAFGQFLTVVFSTMKRGASMCTAWGSRNPQPPGSPEPVRPLTMIQAELDPFTFG